MMTLPKMAVGVLALVVMATGLPRYAFSDSWTEEDIAAFLAEERVRNAIRPRRDYMFNSDGQGIGMVSGVDVDSNDNLYVLHRANRPWVAETFLPGSDELSESYKARIDQDTIFILDPISGQRIRSFGAHHFNVPHGLSIDKDDNIWVTDVGRHQVMRFPKGSVNPDMWMGVEFEPKGDDAHFCKPTDVAVDSNGDIFVADGYCNSRIMKFTSNGTLITKWGTATDQRQDTSTGPDPYNLDVPHSITLVEELDLICVADREHERSLCYNAGINSDRPVGAFNRTLIPQGGAMGKIFAVYYNKPAQNVIAATEMASEPFVNDQGLIEYPARAYTYSLGGKELVDWARITSRIAAHGPTLIHDLCASRNGREFFLGDIVQQKIFKYSI